MVACGSLSYDNDFGTLQNQAKEKIVVKKCEPRTCLETMSPNETKWWIYLNYIMILSGIVIDVMFPANYVQTLIVNNQTDLAFEQGIILQTLEQTDTFWKGTFQGDKDWWKPISFAMKIPSDRAQAYSFCVNISLSWNDDSWRHDFSGTTRCIADSKFCDEIRLIEDYEDYSHLGMKNLFSFNRVLQYNVTVDLDIPTATGSLSQETLENAVVYELRGITGKYRFNWMIAFLVLFIASYIFFSVWTFVIIYYKCSNDYFWSNIRLPERTWILFALFSCVLMLNPVNTIALLSKNGTQDNWKLHMFFKEIGRGILLFFWLAFINAFRRSSLGNSMYSRTRFYGIKIFFCTLYTIQCLLEITDSGKWRYGPSFKLLLAVIYIIWILVSVIRNWSNLISTPFYSSRLYQLSFRFLIVQNAPMLIVLIVRFLLELTHVLLDADSLVKAFDALSHLASLYWLSSTWVCIMVCHIFVWIYMYLPPARSYVHLRILQKQEFFGSYLNNDINLSKLSKSRSGINGAHVSYIPSDCGTHQDSVTSNPSTSFYFLKSPPQIEFRPRFDLDRSCKLLEFSYLSYYDMPGYRTPSGAGMIKIKRLHGHDIVGFIHERQTDTVVLISKSRLTGSIIIAFRGTSSKKNVRTDLKFGMKTFAEMKDAVMQIGRTAFDAETYTEGARIIAQGAMGLQDCSTMENTNAKVHHGFYRAYTSIRARLLLKLEELIDAQTSMIMCTGHSLGGALATFAAYDLSCRMDHHICMYNYGSPRVGDYTFAEMFNRNVKDSFRIAVDGDVVAGILKMATTGRRYKHVGTEIVVDKRGNVIVEPSLMEKHFYLNYSLHTRKHLLINYATGLIASYGTSKECPFDPEMEHLMLNRANNVIMSYEDKSSESDEIIITNDRSSLFIQVYELKGLKV